MGIFNRIDWLVELGIARPPPVGNAPMAPARPGQPAWLIAYATQTGAAERLAHATAAGLREAGVDVELTTFDALSPARVTGRGPLLIIASTSYDGDAPDMAEAFESQHMQAPASLAGLRYGLLALGDRCYADFCGFGRRLHGWLVASGAQALFAPIEVDDEDPIAVSEWYRRVAQQAAARPVA